MNGVVRLLACAGVGLSLAGCGGARVDAEAPAARACGALTAGMPASEVDAVAACLASASGADAAAACREGVLVAARANDAALEDLTDCVLRELDRADGAWLADMLAETATDARRLAVVAGGLGRHFDPAVHGVSLTSALDETTQDALGPLLGALPSTARERLVGLVLAYQLSPLLGYCGPYVRDLDPTDPTVAAFADHVLSAGVPADTSEAWALLATGRWTVDDALACASDERACGAVSDGALALLPEVVNTVRDAGTPNRALRLLRAGGLDGDAVRGLTYALTTADYGNATAVMNALLADMTDPVLPAAHRRAIASAGTERLCAPANVFEFLLRARASDPERLTDASSPWPTYVMACAPNWDALELVALLGAGSWLGVPADRYDALVTSAQTSAEDVSCDALGAAASAVATDWRWLPMRDLAVVVAAQVTGDRCAADFARSVDAIAADGGAHPEARLLAIELQLARGVRSGCGAVDAILSWRHEDYGEGPGPFAETRAAALRARCDG